jgi:hypothetical protein
LVAIVAILPSILHGKCAAMFLLQLVDV